MQGIVSIISFIIWIIYYYFLVNREIVRKNMNKDKYNFKLLKQDIFYLCRLDSLFYLITFYIYKGFNKTSVTIYLFFIFVFSSLVFILYDINDNYDLKKNNFKKEKIYYLICFIIMFIPLIFYLFKKDITNTCFLTLIINFLIPIIIYITRIIRKK